MKSSSLILAAVLLVGSPSLRAQSSGTDTVRLDPVAVTGERPKPLTIPSVIEARADLALTPGGTEVVSAERFLRGRASTVADTFALSAGVFAQSRFGSDEARISIRGSGLQRTFHGRGLRILQDGVPLNLADGSFDMQAFEPLAADYINIWRGGNALAHGSSTLGGAIDYLSRTGRNTNLLLRAETGSHGYLRANATTGGWRNGTDALVSLTHQEQDGFRRHAAQANQRLFANLGHARGPGRETRVYLTGVRTDSELPGNLTLAQLRADPRQAAAGNLALDQKRDFDLLRLATRTTLTGAATAWDFTAAWTYKDLDHPIFQVIDQLTNDLFVGATVDRTASAHRLRAGLSFNRGVIQAANYVNAAGRRGALVSRADQIATNVEAFAEDQLALGRRLTLVLGAAASANRRENLALVGGVPSYAFDYHRVMPKAGLRWDGAGAQFYANVSGSYEPPSFSETLTLNTAREAQTATTWELGTRGTRGWIRWDATLYRAGLRRELLTIDHDNNPATPAATINAQRTTHEGIELALDLDLLGGELGATSPARRLMLRTAWTHGGFRFNGDPNYGRNVIAGLPAHLIRGELSWETASGWYAGPTFEWVPQRTWVDHRNTLAADPYALAGLRLGRRPATGLAWFIEMRNVFDRKHAATTGVIENAGGLDQAQFLPGDGRSFFLGLESRR
jgi:iron complex outermembrane receptor protein